MRKLFAFAAVAAVFVASPAFAVDVVTYNSAPADGWNYGTGNNYTPSNTAVLTAPNLELDLRVHEHGQVAPASDSNGIYSFALGTSPINFDWGIQQSTDSFGVDWYGLSSSTITMTNLLTGASTSYNPYAAPNDNYNFFGGPNSYSDTQNSFQLNWAGIGFDPTVNDTYSITLATGGHSLTAFAQVGSGLGSIPAVPEPATWAMMLLGFGAIGLVMRSRRQPRGLAQIA